jgi:hypothetical protein
MGRSFVMTYGSFRHSVGGDRYDPEELRALHGAFSQAKPVASFGERFARDTLCPQSSWAQPWGETPENGLSP